MMKLSHIYFKIFKDFLRIQIERNFVEFHVCAIFIFFYPVKTFILIVDQQLKYLLYADMNNFSNKNNSTFSTDEKFISVKTFQSLT